MPRVKRGVLHSKRRANILKKAKGFSGGRKKLIKVAKVGVTKAGDFAFRHRKTKKRDARALWQIKISAAAKEHGLSYSRFISGLKKAKIELNRKILSQLAEKEPKIFKQLIDKIKA